jgi:PAS domain S-box-containing protein
LLHALAADKENMKPLGIKAKVALATSVTSIAMVALVTAVQITRMRDDFNKVLFEQQTALINRTAEELDDKLHTLLDVITLTAQKQPRALMDSPAALRRYYDDRSVKILFDDLLILDPRGRVIADVPQITGRVGIDTSDRAYFKTVMRTKKAMITEPVFGKFSHQPVVQMAAPIIDDKGEVKGILLGVLNLYKDNLLGHLRTSKVGKTGYYFALTRGSVPVYVLHPLPERLLQPRPPQNTPATTRALFEGFEGTAEGVSSRGERSLFSYKALKSVNWVLAASLPEDEAFEPFDGVLYRLAAWGAGAALVTALLIGLLTARLLSPLIRLRNAILRLREDVSGFIPIPVGNRDEIGELTAAFNELMAARQAADARIQRLVEFAPNAMLVTDADGRIETINRQAERYFGYRRDEVAGRPVELLMPERFRQQHVGLRQGFSENSLSAEPRRMGQGQSLWGRRRDGSEFPVEINLSRVKTDQGTKVLAVISDITERYALQLEVEARAAELEEERDRAEAANRAKSDFVANMSHEIRTPMNAVLGMAYLLGNTPLNSEQRKYLNMVRVSGQSLLGILNDVLDYSKIEARRMELSPIEFNLDEVMNTLATTMTMSAGDKELELAIAVEPDVPKWLRGDAMRLQQVLVNLAGNAIKFTEAGEVVVRVSLAGAPRDDTALLHFEVRDTGIGMTAQQQAQLFNAFSQGDESITRRFGGTGLGLAITKQLIRMMGGEIAVRTAEGSGSTFWFELPFAVLGRQVEERRIPALGQLRLLVADDSRTSRELIGKLIRSWGWEADEVDSGIAAIERYRSHLDAQRPYDVVLADWHMPGLNGLATAKAIRQAAAEKKQPIVVMVNAFARDRLEEISSAAEADVVLMKPITASSLFDALHEALIAKDGGEERLVQNQGMANRLAGAHFLLVEDNLLNQAVARGILEHAGATLDVVGDGQQAVDLLRSDAQRYDIVLMDMQMPVLDGFSATRILRTDLRLTLPVIAMTAGVLASEHDRSVAAGISDFIAKPVVVEEMMAVILRHLPADFTRTPGAARPPAAPTATLPEPVMPEPTSTSAAAPPAAETQVFSMDSLMRAMGRDAKGRGVLRRIVGEAIDKGLEPIHVARTALARGQRHDAGRALHGLRGSVGVMGAKRLVQASLAAEQAIDEQRDDLVPALVDRLEAELAQVIEQARAWLAAHPD